MRHMPQMHLCARTLLCRQLSFNELVALYAITDVALVTSLRDGMNLGGWHKGGTRGAVLGRGGALLGSLNAGLCCCSAGLVQC